MVKWRRIINSNNFNTYMLSIEECREKLGDLAVGMTDERIVQIRDYLYALCHNVIDNQLKEFGLKK